MADPFAHAAASAAYKASQQLDRRPAATLSRVHDALQRAIGSAIAAHEAGALDQMCRHSLRATQILTGLRAVMEGTSGDVRDLLDFYSGLQSALNRLLRDSSASELLQLHLQHLGAMCKSFRSDINPAA